MRHLTKLRKDLTGKKFNSLYCLRFDHFGPKGRAYYEFICDCGKHKVIHGYHVSGEKTKSCGCAQIGAVQKACGLPDGEAAFNSLFQNYTYHANKRSLSFELTKEEFKKLTRNTCYYCGVEPSQVYTPKKCKTSYIYNGVDRLNNFLGYTKNNSRACCEICNKAKRTLTLDEFMVWIHRLIVFQNRESDAMSVGTG